MDFDSTPLETNQISTPQNIIHGWWIFYNKNWTSTISFKCFFSSQIFCSLLYVNLPVNRSTTPHWQLFQSIRERAHFVKIEIGKKASFIIWYIQSSCCWFLKSKFPSSFNPPYCYHTLYKSVKKAFYDYIVEYNKVRQNCKVWVVGNNCRLLESRWQFSKCCPPYEKLGGKILLCYVQQHFTIGGLNQSKLSKVYTIVIEANTNSRPLIYLWELIMFREGENKCPAVKCQKVAVSRPCPLVLQTPAPILTEQ